MNQSLVYPDATRHLGRFRRYFGPWEGERDGLVTAGRGGVALGGAALAQLHQQQPQHEGHHPQGPIQQNYLAGALDPMYDYIPWGEDVEMALRHESV